MARLCRPQTRRRNVTQFYRDADAAPGSASRLEACSPPLLVEERLGTLVGGASSRQQPSWIVGEPVYMRRPEPRLTGHADHRVAHRRPLHGSVGVMTAHPPRRPGTPCWAPPAPLRPVPKIQADVVCATAPRLPAPPNPARSPAGWVGPEFGSRRGLPSPIMVNSTSVPESRAIDRPITGAPEGAWGRARRRRHASVPMGREGGFSAASGGRPTGTTTVLCSTPWGPAPSSSVSRTTRSAAAIASWSTSEQIHQDLRPRPPVDRSVGGKGKLVGRRWGDWAKPPGQTNVEVAEIATTTTSGGGVRRRPTAQDAPQIAHTQGSCGDSPRTLEESHPVFCGVAEGQVTPRRSSCDPRRSWAFCTGVSVHVVRSEEEDPLHAGHACRGNVTGTYVSSTYWQLHPTERCGSQLSNPGTGQRAGADTRPLRAVRLLGKILISR